MIIKQLRQHFKTAYTLHIALQQFYCSQETEIPLFVLHGFKQNFFNAKRATMCANTRGLKVQVGCQDRLCVNSDAHETPA